MSEVSRKAEDLPAGFPELREQLKHLRWMHFWVIALLLTLLYFLFTSYTDKPELIRELARLDTLQTILSKDAFDIGALYPGWLKSTRRELSQTHLHGILYDDPVFAGSLDVKSVQAMLEGTLVGAMLNQIDDTQPVVRMISGPAEGEEEKLTQLFSRPRGFNIRICKISKLEPDWKNVSTNFIVVALVNFKCSSKAGPNMTDPVFERSDTVRFLFSEIRLPPLLKTKGAFPVLGKYREEIASQTIEEARAWATDKLSPRAQKMTLPVTGGLSIQSRDVAIVLPFCILVLTGYMIVYMIEIERSLKFIPSVQILFVPWMGVMNSRVARVATGATLGVMPSVASVMALYRHVWPSLWWLVYGLLLALAGYYVCRKARDISLLTGGLLEGAEIAR